MAGGSDGQEWGLRNKNGWEQAQTARSQHPTVLVCLSPSTATRASAQQLRTAGRMNHLSTIPPKTTRVTVLSSTRLNKRARPGASRRLEEQKEALGPSQAFPHLQPVSLCREQHRQNPGGANQSGNEDERRPPCCDSPSRFLERAQRGK